jgi:hypothetical protein
MIFSRNVNKLFWLLAAITLIVASAMAFLPEWLVSGFHVGG